MKMIQKLSHTHAEEHASRFLLLWAELLFILILPSLFFFDSAPQLLV